MMNGIVVFSGYNFRAVVAFCRFANEHNLPIHLIAKDPGDPIFLTDYGRLVCATRLSPHLDSPEFLRLVKHVMAVNGYKRVLVMPSTEALNRFMLDNREELESNGVIVPLVEKNLYARISDKHSFGAMCKLAGFKVPFEFDAIPNQYPYVAKPRKYCSSTGRQLKPYLILCDANLKELKNNETLGDYYFQEYIQGRSLYLLFNVSRVARDVAYSQENLIQQAAGGSIVCAVSSTEHTKTIAKQYLDFLKLSGFCGLIMIELKQTGSDYYMIEANPRMWGPMQLVVDARVPILSAFLHEHGVVVKDALADDECGGNLYFWSGGVVQDQEKGNTLAFHDFTEAEFFSGYSRFIRQDVFFRNDTIGYYYKELHAK